jgi:hypothetical protein
MDEGRSMVRLAVEHPLNSEMGNGVAGCHLVRGGAYPDLPICELTRVGE